MKKVLKLAGTHPNTGSQRVHQHPVAVAQENESTGNSVCILGVVASYHVYSRNKNKSELCLCFVNTCNYNTY